MRPGRQILKNDPTIYIEKEPPCPDRLGNEANFHLRDDRYFNR